MHIRGLLKDGLPVPESPSSATFNAVKAECHLAISLYRINYPEKQGLTFHEFFLNRHFFDTFDNIGTVLHMVPLLVTHPHKKAA